MPRGFTVDSQDGIKDPVGMSGVRMEVETNIISGSTTVMRNLVKCVQQVGANVEDLVFGGLASAEAVLSDTERELGCALVDIGGETTQILIFTAGSPVYASVVPYGGQSITNDLAVGLRVSLEDAEKIKQKFSAGGLKEVRDKKDEADISDLGLEIQSVPSSFVENIIESRISEIVSMVGLEIKNSGQGEKCHEYLALACEGNPTAEVLSNYAGIFTQTGNPEKAQELCERALAKNPEIAIAHWNLSLALLESGQWERAWDEHEWGLKKSANTSSMRVDRDIGKAPYWDGTPGKTVAVYGEQGIGDEIMFASMLPDLLKTNTVILECHKRLKHLFELNFPVIPIYGTREDSAISWPFDHEIDYRVSIGSLGKFFRRTKESFPGTPYLKAEPATKGKKFRVGISWTGGQKASRVMVRTVPLSWWKAILCNDCEFISLQYTDCAEEISIVEKQGYSIKQFPEIKSDDTTRLPN